MQLIERMRHSLSNISSIDRTFHHFLLFHLLHSMTFRVSPTQIQMMRMMMRRRSSRDEQQIGLRPWRDTVRDRSQGVPLVPLATPPLLTIRAMHVLTPTTMMVMVVPGLLQEVLGLQEVMILIGRTSRQMMSRC